MKRTFGFLIAGLLSIVSSSYGQEATPISNAFQVPGLRDALETVCKAIDQKPFDPDLSAMQVIDALRLQEIQNGIFEKLLSDKERAAFKFFNEIGYNKDLKKNGIDQKAALEINSAQQLTAAILTTVAKRKLPKVLDELNSIRDDITYEQDFTNHVGIYRGEGLTVRVTFKHPEKFHPKLKPLAPLVIYMRAHLDGSSPLPQLLTTEQFWMGDTEKTPIKGLENSPEGPTLGSFFDGFTTGNRMCDDLLRGTPAPKKPEKSSDASQKFLNNSIAGEIAPAATSAGSAL
ncbi:hypothetical protein K2X30_05940 [bacterium]|jgi:hypothetical protein|nr:hypothetical protein [bacterium]